MRSRDLSRMPSPGSIASPKETTSARTLIDRLDQAVLAKAFRGELVPQDPNDEPASALLERIEALAPDHATTYALFTGAGSARNQRMYKKAGYRLRGEIEPGVVRMTKRISPR